ncbi:hypothetical protein BG000_004836 [Podila horticola]|nr:hypothetical protein BG000_004836 [Podila horticola]
MAILIPISRSRNKNIDSILKLIAECKMSLGQFLEACFESSDEKVNKVVDAFFDRGYAGRCLEIWTRRITKKNHIKKVLPKAVSFVLKHAEAEMKTISRDASLRNPATEMSAETAARFSFQTIEDEFARLAPTVFELLRGIAKRPSPFDKNPPVAVMASIALKTWNRKMNYFQGMLALYFYTQRASSSLIDVLQNAGISTSFDYVLKALKSMAEKQVLKVRSLVGVEKRPFLIAYDNINMAFRCHDQRSDNKDTFENGTTATLIITPDWPAVEQTQHAAGHLNAEDLQSNQEQNRHLASTYRFHLAEVLRRRVDPSFANPIAKPVKNELPVERTEAYPLPSMHIDQSTAEGNRDILDHIMVNVLELGEDWFENQARVIIAGDQLTLARVRLIMRLRWDEKEAFYRLEWAVPVLQLFHLQMVIASTIIKTHYGTTDTPGSLSYLIRALDKKRINQDKADFHTMDEFLRHTFDALVLIIWELEFDDDDLATRISMGGPDLHLDIKTKVDHILQKYLSSKTNDKVGNQQSKNAALFLRDMPHYIELGSAIKAGDIGRIEESIRWLTLFLQAGSTKNYANELLRLHCAIFHSWKDNDSSKKTILRSMLVNTTGRPNRWIPTDLYQEHNNLLTKTVYSAKGSNSTWKFMNEKISPNVRVLQGVARHVEEMFGAPHKGTNHSPASATAEISKIKKLCTEANIFKSTAAPLTKDILAVTNLLQTGWHNITSGTRIADFKKTCGPYGYVYVNGPTGATEIVEEEDMDSEEDEQMESEDETEGELESDIVIELETDNFVHENFF